MIATELIASTLAQSSVLAAEPTGINTEGVVTFFASNIAPILLAVLGIMLVGESLNDLADPRLRSRRRVAQAAGEVAETSVVPGGTLTAGPGGLGGLEDGETFDEHGIEVKR